MAFKYLMAAVNLIMAIVFVIVLLAEKENEWKIGTAVFALAFFANVVAILLR